MAKQTDRLGAAAAGLQQAEAELTELQQRLATIERDAATARQALADDLAGVPIDQLQAAAVKQAEARIRLDAAESAAGEIRRRIGRQETAVRQARAHYGAVLVESRQAELDDQTRRIVAILQHALQELDEQRQAELQLHEEAGVTPRVAFGPGFIEQLRHKTQWVAREIGE